MQKIAWINKPFYIHRYMVPYSQNICVYPNIESGQTYILPSSLHTQPGLIALSLTLWTWLTAAANHLQWKSGVSPTFRAIS